MDSWTLFRVVLPLCLCSYSPPAWKALLFPICLPQSHLSFQPVPPVHWSQTLTELLSRLLMSRAETRSWMPSVYPVHMSTVQGHSSMLGWSE